MTQAKQAQDEIRWATAMAGKLGMDLLRAPEKRAEPQPDIRLALADGRMIAVEIVEATHEVARKGFQGSLGLIADIVTTRMRERRMAATVGLSFSFSEVGELGKLPGKTLRDLAATIVNVVEEPRPQLQRGERGWIYQDPGAVERFGMQHVGDLTPRGLSRLDWMLVGPWHDAVVLTGARGMTPGFGLIQDAIDRKARKRNSYDLVGADELWLLVVGSTGIGGALDRYVTTGRVFTSPFDHTIFLDCNEDECVVLATKRAD